MFKIIYEDNYIFIIDKNYNLIVNNIKNDINEINLINLIKEYYPKISNIVRNGIVHRIDKDTTGLLVIAKNNFSFNKLIESFINKKNIKIYISLVCGKILYGNTIIKKIKRNKNKRLCMKVDNNGKLSITHYRIIKKFNLFSYIIIKIDTGRTHQIRVHMSYIKHPIIFDFKYGKNISCFTKIINYINKLNYPFYKRQCLHSYILYVYHPYYKKLIKFKSCIPYDIKNLLYLLK
ncbi:RluA family pseudouridine synthase [Candidatus Nardonella dryophthoridicola]|uniref:RNA pseudouridine synthase n=1 Tax=endosymbiont of Metamasius hemipterus TaxID=204627 RepID=A0ABT0TWG1_9GAMM|nr:RNA pseudouridine synthase [Candidatus Nardonella dryophthoridicola]MCM0158335.1 RNA pseudouridine synthase [endosymbiont of Metamasius hemipterus]